MRGLCLALLCALGPWLWGQGGGLQVHGREWPFAQLMVDVGPKWRLLLEGSYRWEGALERHTQTLGRAWAGYAVRPSWTLAGAMVVSHVPAPSGGGVLELRPHVDVLHRWKGERLSVVNRGRLELRAFHPLDAYGAGRWHALRLRHMVQVDVPLGAWGRVVKVSLLGQEEQFLQVPGRSVSGLWQMGRAGVGPSFGIGKHLVVNALWMTEYGAVSRGLWRWDQIAWVQVRWYWKVALRG